MLGDGILDWIIVFSGGSVCFAMNTCMIDRFCYDVCLDRESVLCIREEYSCHKWSMSS